MIHKDLFGQKEEIESKKFLGYDNIPTETRLRVFFVFTENVAYVETIATGYGNPITRDYQYLRYEICKYKGIPNISEEPDDRDAIYEWLMTCSVMDFLRTIELFICLIKKDYTLMHHIRLKNIINDINDIFMIERIGYEIVGRQSLYDWCFEAPKC